MTLQLHPRGAPFIRGTRVSVRVRVGDSVSVRVRIGVRVSVRGTLQGEEPSIWCYLESTRYCYRHQSELPQGNLRCLRRI